MKLRHFWGKDMNDALRGVRAKLGSDALIMDSRCVPSENGEGVEITAMQEEEDRHGRQKRGGEEGWSRSDSSVISEVRQELSELKSFLGWLVPGMGRNKVLEELLTQGVSPEIIARLAREVEGMEGADEWEKIRQVLARLIPTGGDVESRGERRECLALIGPTGVGKATTVVKLTVRLTRQGERRVGWVSLDGRRIAGAEQLGVYAGILGIPHEVLESRDGLGQALERLSDCDLVLIDTAGVNPRDDESLDELAGLTREVADLKSSLLISAATNSRDMSDWVRLYERVGFDSLLFTKVDECRHFGPLINVTLGCGRPLSYITNGQRVVGDLELARYETLACLLSP